MFPQARKLMNLLRLSRKDLNNLYEVWRVSFEYVESLALHRRPGVLVMIVLAGEELYHAGPWAGTFSAGKYDSAEMLLNLVVTTTLLDQLGPWSWGKGPYAGDAWADGWLESEGEW